MKITTNSKMILIYALTAFVGVIIYRLLSEFLIFKIVWLLIVTLAMTFISTHFLQFAEKIIQGKLILNFFLFFIFFCVLCFVVIGNCFELKVWMLCLFAYAWAIPMAILEKKKLLLMKEK